MATYFGGSGNYLSRASAIVTAPPLTVSAWIRRDALTAQDNIFSVGDGTSTHRMEVVCRITAGTAFVDVGHKGATAFGTARSTTEALSGVWVHVFAQFLSNTSRTVWVNNAGNVTDVVDSGAMTTPDETKWGAGMVGGDCLGALRECALWNVGNLTADERTALYKGYSPRFIRPSALISHMPFIGGNATYDATGKVWTLTGAASSSGNDPAIIRPYKYIPPPHPPWVPEQNSDRTIIQGGGLRW